MTNRKIENIKSGEIIKQYNEEYNYFKCYQCGNYVEEENFKIDSPDKNTYCGDCYLEIFSDCFQCGDTICREYLIEYNEDFYCSDCYNDLNKCRIINRWEHRSPSALKEHYENTLKDIMVYPITCNVYVDKWADEEKMLEEYPRLNLKQNNRKSAEIGLCFNFALDNNKLQNCEETYKILKNKYMQISIKEAQAGDLIVYITIKEDIINPLHFAIIQYSKGTLYTTIILSKWGQLGIYESDISSVPCDYGDYIEIWHRK